MTVTELREALQKLEAEGKGRLVVTDWEQSEIETVKVQAESRFRGLAPELPFVEITP